MPFVAVPSDMLRAGP